jgi:hypothetical protein
VTRLSNADELLAAERRTREAARAASQSVAAGMITQGTPAKVVRRVNEADPNAKPEWVIARPVTEDELAAIDNVPDEQLDGFEPEEDEALWFDEPEEDEAA